MGTKRILSYLLLIVILGLFVYIAILMKDILFYESTISEVYNVSTQIVDKEYEGDYVASIIDAKSVKISIIAIVITAIGSLLTFAAFLIQKQANEIHRTDIKTERLIANYTKLMDVHCDIINSIKIGADLKGHAAFHFLFYELKSIYAHLVEKYPFLKNPSHTYAATHICMKIFMSGCTGEDDSKLIHGIHSDIGSEYDKLDLETFIKELVEINRQFINYRIPPSCFIFEKYSNEKEFPNLPPLYKGNLQRLSSYFNLVDVFLCLEGNMPSLQTELYRKMFAMQFSIHESAILDFYFRSMAKDGSTDKCQSSILLLCEARKQYPATFDIDNEEFCKSVN